MKRERPSAPTAPTAAAVKRPTNPEALAELHARCDLHGSRRIHRCGLQGLGRRRGPCGGEQDEPRGDVGEHHQTQHRTECRSRRAGHNRPQVDRRHLFEDLEGHRGQQSRPHRTAEADRLPGQPRDDPGEQQPGDEHRDRQRRNPQRHTDAGNILQPKPFQHLFHHACTAQHGQRDGEGQREKQAHHGGQIRQLGADESLCLLPHQAPHLTQRLTQVRHPAQARPRGSDEPDDPDRGARVDGRLHQLDQLLADVAGDRRLDLLLDFGEQVGPVRQDEAADRESDHQQWEQREDREVRDARGVEVALAVLVPLLGPHHVVEPLVPFAQTIQNSRFGRLI